MSRTELSCATPRLRSLCVGEGGDLRDRADIIVSEIMDCGLLGEVCLVGFRCNVPISRSQGMLPSLRFAQKHLAKADTLFLPQRAVVRAVAIECFPQVIRCPCTGKQTHQVQPRPISSHMGPDNGRAGLNGFDFSAMDIFRFALLILGGSVIHLQTPVLRVTSKFACTPLSIAGRFDIPVSLGPVSFCVCRICDEFDVFDFDLQNVLSVPSSRKRHLDIPIIVIFRAPLIASFVICCKPSMLGRRPTATGLCSGSIFASSKTSRFLQVGRFKLIFPNSVSPTPKDPSNSTTCWKQALHLFEQPVLISKQTNILRLKAKHDATRISFKILK